MEATFSQPNVLYSSTPSTYTLKEIMNVRRIIVKVNLTIF